MLSRVLLVLSVLSLMVSLISAATCVARDTCVTGEFKQSSGSPTNLQVQISFTFDSQNGNSVCALSTGLNAIQDSTNGPLNLLVYTITGTTGGSVLVNNLLEVTQFNALTFTAVAQGTTTPVYTGTLTGTTQQNQPTVANSATVTLTFTGPLFNGATTTSSNNVVLVPFDTPDVCVAAGGGDPFFSGFQGQQFFVAGETGAVMNVLSSFNLQLNSRIVFLDNGDALMPAEQERLFLLSQIRNAADPSVPVLDHTTYWSHPGTYFGEAGVAMIDGHRLYAKPGLYKDGWATVTLDDKPLAVSDEYTVLGSGVNAITIARPSTHRIIFRTLNVEFSLINSDLFFNVEQAHLEKGWHTHAHFDGVMGRTAKPGFQWSPEMEKEVTVQSGDLFEFVAQPL